MKKVSQKKYSSPSGQIQLLNVAPATFCGCPAGLSGAEKQLLSLPRKHYGYAVVFDTVVWFFVASLFLDFRRHCFPKEANFGETRICGATIPAFFSPRFRYFF